MNHSAKKQHHEQARKKHRHEQQEHARELAKKKPSMAAFWILVIGLAPGGGSPGRDGLPLIGVGSPASPDRIPLSDSRLHPPRHVVDPRMVGRLELQRVVRAGVLDHR